MSEPLCFKTRSAFRTWLVTNCVSSKGVWLQFSKIKGRTIQAGEALEEALCFGWIDGVMKRVDEEHYLKYFSLRRKNSKWSEKNKALVQRLEKQGQLTEYGKDKIAEAKANGQWDKASKPPAITAEEIGAVAKLLTVNQGAYDNFQKMSPSVKKTYARAYLEAKTTAGQTRRLAWMIDRLERNLKPM